MRYTYHLVLASTLLLCGVQDSAPAPEGLAARAERAALDLQELGFDVDLSRVSIETGTKRQFRKHALAQMELCRPADQLDTMAAWLQGFGVWRFEDGQALIEHDQRFALRHVVRRRELR